MGSRMSDAYVKNAADASQVKDARRKEVDAAKQYAADVLEVATAPAGQRFLRALIAECGVFTGGTAPDLHLSYRAGKRDIGLMLIAHLTLHAPDYFPRILLASTKDSHV